MSFEQIISQLLIVNKELTLARNLICAECEANCTRLAHIIAVGIIVTCQTVAGTL